GVVRFQAGNRWQHIDWQATEGGDGTVPESSAVPASASSQLPIVDGHGDIYVTPAVLEFLRWELVDRYRAVVRAALATEALRVEFMPDRAVYAPAETIGPRASARR